MLIVLSSTVTFVKALPAERVLAGHPASLSPAVDLAAFVTEASQRFDVPAVWIRAVIRIESGGQAGALSRKGAMGLMQIMPETWAELRARYDLGSDPYDPHDNIMAGAAYISELRDRYGVPGFLAAYNAGPRQYEDHLATGRGLPAETRTYVALLTPLIAGGHPDGRIIAGADPLAWEHAPLFIAQAERGRDDNRRSLALDWGGAPSAGAVVDLPTLMPRSAGLFVHLGNGAGSQ
jgi:hypothetical protein